MQRAIVGFRVLQATLFENKKGVVEMKAGFRHVVMVVYDGVENSVFESQVVAPLLAELEQDERLQVTVISFERAFPRASTLKKKFPAHDRLHLILGQKFPFFGKMSLRPAVSQLIKILKEEGGSELRARGPLAGWILLQAVQQLANIEAILRGFIPPVLIQARGLAAEEHRYASSYASTNPLRLLKDYVICKLLERVEKEVYGYRGLLVDMGRFTLETVSLALGDYLKKTFHADSDVLTLASRDITPRIDAERVATLRIKKRAELGIAPQANVYVYSGSFKPWQCAQETIAEAASILRKDPHAFFLVLSGDVEKFNSAIKAAAIDMNRCLITCIPSAKLTEYLAVADTGFLLREPHVINWVSRPTKLLEYRAVGLEIRHNNTVGCLVNRA